MTTFDRLSWQWNIAAGAFTGFGATLGTASGWLSSMNVPNKALGTVSLTALAGLADFTATTALAGVENGSVEGNLDNLFISSLAGTMTAFGVGYTAMQVPSIIPLPVALEPFWGVGSAALAAIAGFAVSTAVADYLDENGIDTGTAFTEFLTGLEEGLDHITDNLAAYMETRLDELEQGTATVKDVVIDFLVSVEATTGIIVSDTIDTVSSFIDDAELAIAGEDLSLEDYQTAMSAYFDYMVSGTATDNALANVFVTYTEDLISWLGTPSDTSGWNALVGAGGMHVDAGGSGDWLLGLGRSYIAGQDGNDVMFGYGVPVLDGGAGADWIGFYSPNFEEGRPLTVYAGDGDDSVAGSGQQLYIDLGAGNDIALVTSLGASPQVIDPDTGETDTPPNPSVTIKGDAGDDTIVATNFSESGDGQTLEEERAEMIIDAGVGDDWVLAFGAAEISLGDGNDVLLHAGAGSVIHTGPGGESDQDTILFSPGTLVTDADGWDRIAFATGLYAPELMIANGNSESQWAYGLSGLVKAGFNTDGEMVLAYGWETDPDKWMYLANGNNDPYADAADLTAGIRIGSLQVNAYQLQDIPAGLSVWASNQDLWEFTRLALKDFHSEARVAGADPLVLDLDGDGLELTAVYSAAPAFDVDGDGFAEPTGWVRPDDGFLALDSNGDGVINDVSELFGGADQSGFAELALLDDNGDGVIDVSDAAYSDLLVWRDLDGDGETDEGELQSLAEAGIASIGLTATEDGSSNADNVVARLGTFTWDDGSSGTIGDIEFRINNFNTTYTGDTSVDAALVTGMPNLKGHGTLTDLHVALTLEGSGGQLSAAISALSPNLNVIDLEALRENALPILEAWAAAPPAQAGVSANPDVPVLVRRDGTGLTVTDFAVEVTEEVTLDDGSTQMLTFWRLASGGAVRDAGGNVIDYPSYDEVLAQIVAETDTGWEVLTGAELDFLERFYGEEIPIEDPRSLNSGAISGLSALLAQSVHLMELQALRLAMQGPLASYFDGVDYDVEADTFSATTDRQLVPMFEAIFTGAPADTAGAESWLASWEPLIDAMLADYDRGGTLTITYPFLFTMVVAAAENTGFVLDPKTAAVALGIPAEMIVTGSGAIAGSDAAEIFYLSAGDDTVTGGGGADVYVIGRNFGNDTIDDYEDLLQHSYDVIRFAHHEAEDVTFYRDGLDMRIVDNITGETLTITGQFHNLYPDLSGSNVGTEQGVDEIIFADGTVWTRSNIAKAVSHPTDAGETLIGTDHMDYLDGGAGNDYLSGGSGSDIYVFGHGYGQDQIEENMGNILLPTHDFVLFGPGISEEDLVFSRNGNSDDLIVSIAGTVDQLTITNQFSAAYTGVFGTQWLHTVETFLFEDGTSLDWTEVAQATLDDMATDGDDVIYGFSLEDTIQGGLGDDYLSGGNENDLYIYTLGDGNDIIEENLGNILSGQTDRLQLNGFGPDDVTVYRDAANLNDLEIHMPDGAVVTIKGQFDVVYGLGAYYFDRIEYFDFVADDGTVTTLTAADVMDRVLADTSTGGDDVIYGFKRAEDLEGGLGDDYLAGLEGSDVYIYNIGDGHDTIEDQGYNILGDGSDTLAFGEGISPDDITIAHTAVNSDLTLSLAGHGGSVTLAGQVSYTTINYRPNQIEEVTFADGTVWTPEDLREKALLDMSSDGDDVITGFFSNDILNGGAGNDILSGGDGIDTYKFDYGYGHDSIWESLRYVTYEAAKDKVEFGDGITPDDVTVRRGVNDNQLVLELVQSGETLTIEEQGRGTWYGVEEFHFSDGTVWTFEDAYRILLESEATDGDDTISGFYTADTLEGGLGDDTLEGWDGSDTYVFTRGDGIDVIEDNGWGDTDQLLIHGYTPDEVVLTRDGTSNNLIITFTGTSDQITLTNTLNGNINDQIEQIVFDDNTVWTMADVRSMLISQASTDGDDTIIGTSSADLLGGGLGNDTLEGKDGSDTYVFSRGDGVDVIEDNGWGDTDQLLIQGYDPSEVVLSRDGTSNTLIITFTGTTDQITLINTLNGNYWDQIEQITFDDGTVWAMADVRAKLIEQSQTDGDDTVTGFGTSGDTLEGGLGNDRLEGWDGSDTYVFSRGDGADVVEDNGWGDTDQLVIHGYTPGETVLTRDGTGYNLIISFTGTADQITLTNSLNGNYWDQIEQITFDDGTVWTMADVRTMLIEQSQTDGDDTVTGFGTSADTLEGGLGNDTLEGWDGSDTYVFNRGDGVDVIEDNGWGDTDQLLIQGYTPGEVVLTRDGTSNSLIITFASTSDQITLINTLNGNYWDQIEQIVFDDGTVWTMADVRAKLIEQSQTDGDDTVTGFGTSGDTLEGGLGNDRLEGWDGSDTYVFTRGDGVDVIEDNGWGDTDQLLIQGYTPDEVVLTRDGTSYNLIITFTGTTDQITLVNTLNGSWQDQIEQIVFDDVTEWSMDDVNARLVTGTTGDDQLTGTSADETLQGLEGNDTLTGGDGDDYLEGGDGDDAFVFAADFGNDIITDFVAGAGTEDAIEFNTVTGLTCYAEVLAKMADDGTDATITLDADNTIVLQNVLVPELHSDDFRFA